MRLIDADKLKFSSVVAVGADGIPVLSKEKYISKSEIDAMPPVEAEPIRYGRWIPIKKRICHCNQFDDIIEEVVTSYCCSECGAEEKNRYFYCHCGAKMDGKENYETNI